MKRAWCMLAVVLVGCQAQASHPSPSPATTGKYSDLIYVQDANGGKMLELNWSGKVVGSVAAANFGIPAADGSKYLRSGDHLSIEDWHGRQLGQFDGALNAYGTSVWADDNTHLCGIAFAANTSTDAGQGSLWVAAPGEKVHTVGPVGINGSDPAVMSCSIANNLAIVAGGASPHWPPGANRYLITTEVAAINLTTGAVTYHHIYPQGNLGGQLAAGPPGNWVLVTPSPDGRYLAESGVFNNTSIIREIATNKQLATYPGSVIGFSADGSRVVVDLGVGQASVVQVMTWADQHVIWQKAGQASGVLPRPASPELVVVMPNATGNNDLEAVTEAGAEVTIATNVWMPSICPCHPGA